MIQKARTVIPAANANLARAFKSGVRIALGTDAGVYPHGLNGRELHKMVDMGLTPLQSIQAATVNAADLIAVDGDPTRDATTFQNLRFVMKGGEVVKNAYAK